MEQLGALSGLVVLDLTQFLSGPYATQILGNLGAKIIKVESLEGDSSRSIPPYQFNGESGYYLSTNRNKHSISLDLKKEEGRRIVLELAKDADIIMVNFRPGVLERLKLTYEDLKEVNPNIIMCSITGFGESGPYRNRPAYDMVVQALSGVMSLTGEENGKACRTGVPIGDLVAGLYADIAALSALWTRMRTGKGQKVEVSMLDGQISFLSYLGVYYLLSGDVAGRQGSSHVSIPTYRTFTCGDHREIVITANTQDMWKRLCDVIEHPELTTDARFITNNMRLKNREELWPILEQAFLTQPSDIWMEKLIEKSVPAAPVQTIDQSLNDEHILSRSMVEAVEHSLGGKINLIGNPIKMETPDPQPVSPPVLGEHTVSLLQKLGYDEAMIDDLIESKVVYQHPNKKGVEHHAC
jgi:CoA:oxalate CoA-transferase